MFEFLNCFCRTCDDIIEIMKDPSSNDTTSSVLLCLHQFLSNNYIFDLFSAKSKSNNFSGTIKGKSWLLSAVEAQDNILLSYIFSSKKKDVQDNIILRGFTTYDKLSAGLIPLLLEKTNDYQMVRKEFFQIMTSYFINSNDAIEYVKKYADAFQARNSVMEQINSRIK